MSNNWKTVLEHQTEQAHQKIKGILHDEHDIDLSHHNVPRKGLAIFLAVLGLAFLGAGIAPFVFDGDGSSMKASIQDALMPKEEKEKIGGFSAKNFNVESEEINFNSNEFMPLELKSEKASTSAVETEKPKEKLDFNSTSETLNLIPLTDNTHNSAAENTNTAKPIQLKPLTPVTTGKNPEATNITDLKPIQTTTNSGFVNPFENMENLHSAAVEKEPAQFKVNTHTGKTDKGSVISTIQDKVKYTTKKTINAPKTSQTGPKEIGLGIVSLFAATVIMRRKEV